MEMTSASIAEELRAFCANRPTRIVATPTADSEPVKVIEDGTAAGRSVMLPAVFDVACCWSSGLLHFQNL